MTSLADKQELRPEAFLNAASITIAAAYPSGLRAALALAEPEHLRLLDDLEDAMNTLLVANVPPSVSRTAVTQWENAWLDTCRRWKT